MLGTVWSVLSTLLARAKVRVRVEEPAIVTREVIDDLDLKPSDKVEVIKSTPVMIAKGQIESH